MPNYEPVRGSCLPVEPFRAFAKRRGTGHAVLCVIINLSAVFGAAFAALVLGGAK